MGSGKTLKDLIYDMTTSGSGSGTWLMWVLATAGFATARCGRGALGALLPQTAASQFCIAMEEFTKGAQKSESSVKPTADVTRLIKSSAKLTRMGQDAASEISVSEQNNVPPNSHFEQNIHIFKIFPISDILPAVMPPLLLRTC